MISNKDVEEAIEQGLEWKKVWRNLDELTEPYHTVEYEYWILNEQGFGLTMYGIPVTYDNLVSLFHDIERLKQIKPSAFKKFNIESIKEAYVIREE